MGTLVDLAKKLRPLIEKAAASLDDNDAVEAINLFPVWTPAVHYLKDNRVNYQEVLYKCLMDHDAQLGWEPMAAPSLWAKVLIPDPSVIPEWEQPGSTNGYMIGDKVRYHGKIWESTINNNIWPPDTTGTQNLWKEVLD